MNVAADPTATVKLAGCEEMDGGTGGASGAEPPHAPRETVKAAMLALRHAEARKSRNAIKEYFQVKTPAEGRAHPSSLADAK